MNNNNSFMAFNSNQFPVWSNHKNTTFLKVNIWKAVDFAKNKLCCWNTRIYWDANNVIVNLYLKQQNLIVKFFVFIMFVALVQQVNGWK